MQIQTTPFFEHQIKQYTTNTVTIGEKTYKNSLLVTIDRLIIQPHLDGCSPSELKLEQLPANSIESSSLLLIGSNSNSLPFNPNLSHALLAIGCSVEIMQIGAACRTFNLLLTEERPVVGLFLLND